jgi:YVTN family beta-propeller protein
VSPDATSVYVANFFNPIEGAPGTISQYDVGAGGALSPKNPATVVAGGNPRIVGIAPDGRSVYVSDLSQGVLQFSVGTGGVLSPKTPSALPAGQEPLGLAVSPDGGSVYVTNRRSDDVSQYDVGGDGTLSPKSPAAVPAGDVPLGVAVSPLSRAPTTKQQCKNGGYRQFGFRNQGQCIAFVNRGPQP